MTDDLEARRKATAIRERAAKLTDEQMNANLRAAVKGHTPHGDRKQAAVDRAIAETDRNVLVKRERHVLQPSDGQREGPDMRHLANYDLNARPGDLTRQREWQIVEDDFEQRVKLLETK